VRIAGLGIVSYIGIVILAVVIAITIIFTYFPLQSFLFARGEFLLFISSELNMIPLFMIMILIIYALFRLKEKYFQKQIEKIEDDDKPIEIENLTTYEKFFLGLLNKLTALDDKIMKIWKVIKICYISVLIIAIYCGMTSYAILYNDSIRINSPIVPSGVIYKYSDIKSINVGVTKVNRNSYSPYYDITFNNGQSVNLFGGTMQEGKDIGFEYILIDLDKNLKAQGVIKNVDKENFEKYSKGLDKDFVSRVEKLFDDK